MRDRENKIVSSGCGGDLQSDRQASFRESAGH
jgi:hypothetical protein